MGENTSQPPRRWRFRFSLWTLLIAFTLFSLTAGVAGWLLREGFGRAASATYVLAATAAPLALVVILGTVKWVQELWQKRRRRRQR